MNKQVAKCPECLATVTQQELDDFGGICEQCHEDELRESEEQKEKD